ncbi:MULTISPECIES: sulfatase [Haloferacaceae]|uniref:Sulfatase n=1 Tax=Halorubrum glutamatedens TaxID=2707018 RepID=A0ABD5QS41_9EURY|nr:sulfatase [Halobellus captivus]
MGDPRNVVLVTIDSLRADRCGHLGHDGGLTPTIDELAEDGLRFHNAIAPDGSTRGSSTTFMTGDYPFDRPGVDRRETIRRQLRARDTIAERFGRMGYETGAFTANPWTSRSFGFDKGFDHFEDFMDDTTSNRFDVDGNGDGGAVRGTAIRLLDWWEGQEMFMSWESFYDDIERWIRSAEEPYFLWVFLVDVHMPYIPPKEYLRFWPLTYAANAWLFGGANDRTSPLFRKQLLSAYDRTVEYTDDFVATLLDDVGDDTAVCVHADHGELFGEDGRYGHGYLHESVINVPLVVGNVPAERVDRPVSLEAIPELLTGLAVGDRPTVERPYVTTRNNAGMRIARGSNWRYQRTTGGESVSIRENGQWHRREEHPLYEIGRSIVRRRDATDAERERVATAVRDLEV